jgi:hypothetical protein
MTARQGKLFSVERRTRVVLMHVSDAGGCDAPDADVIVTMRCRKCGHETGWIKCRTVSEAKRGVPCPKCNPSGKPIPILIG